jgi:hypothetical protein
VLSICNRLTTRNISDKHLACVSLFPANIDIMKIIKSLVMSDGNISINWLATETSRVDTFLMFEFKFDYCSLFWECIYCRKRTLNTILYFCRVACRIIFFRIALHHDSNEIQSERIRSILVRKTTHPTELTQTLCIIFSICIDWHDEAAWQ